MTAAKKPAKKTTKKPAAAARRVSAPRAKPAVPTSTSTSTSTSRLGERVMFVPPADPRGGYVGPPQYGKIVAVMPGNACVEWVDGGTSGFIALDELIKV